MEHWEISFYQHFKCSGKACPATCCRGWKILVDDDTYGHIRKEPGAFGKKLRFLIGGKDSHHIRQPFGRCPFLNKEGLCSLQLKGRMDCMSWICQEYPRRILEFGSFTETTLELACPEAARLFLAHGSDCVMKPAETPPCHIMWRMDNEDAPFLAFLCRLRDVTLKQIEGCRHFDAVALQELYDGYKGLHELILNNQLSKANEAAAQMSITGGDGSFLLFYPMGIMDRVIAYNLDIPGGIKAPLAGCRPLLRRYYHFFNSLTEEKAARFFHDKMAQMMEALPGTAEKYRAYYRYYLYEMLLSVYEDYHLWKVILLGHMYLQLYMVFDLVSWLDCCQKKLPYDDAAQALVLSALERRMRHSVVVREGILGRIRQEFLGRKE